MTRPPPPADNDLLCESCGYILNGLELSAASHCPECGEPLATSLDPAARGPAPIEAAWTRANFWRTTGRILFRKRRFFRETRARGDDPSVRRFGRRHRIIAAVLLGVGAHAHLLFMLDMRSPNGWFQVGEWSFHASLPLVAAVTSPLVAVFAVVAYWTLIGVTRLAIAMTAVESRFWGMRLSRGALTRAMDFHAANYLPVGLVAVLITVGYRIAIETGWLTAISGVAYLVTLCVAVVAGAVWLFESFVIAMRRIRYANF